MRAIFVIIILTYLTACGGGGDEPSSAPVEQAQPSDTVSNDTNTDSSNSDSTNTDNDDSTSQDDTPQSSLSDLIVPANFDWASTETKTVSLNLVSSVTELPVSFSDETLSFKPANIGGKHFIKVEALDADSNVVSTPLKSLTSVVGSVKTVMKLPPNVTQLKITAKPKDQECTKQIPVSELSDSLDIECDIAVTSDSGEEQ